jgi:hypothetical protein
MTFVFFGGIDTTLQPSMQFGDLSIFISKSLASIPKKNQHNTLYRDIE